MGTLILCVNTEYRILSVKSEKAPQKRVLKDV